MNKMIVFNPPANGFNKKKIMITLGIVILFVLAVKVLGGGIYSESPPQVVETNTTYNGEVQESDKIKIDDQQQEAAFFSSYRMEREKVRSKEIDVLSEVINGQDNDQQARVVAVNRLVKITENMEEEMRAEQLLKSIGYIDSVVIMQPGTATAVIQASQLELEEKEELKEILGRVTNCKTEAVSIIVNRGE